MFEIKENETTMSLDSAKTRIGKKTIIIKDLKKAYNDHVLFENFSYMLRRFDRLGIIGKNGAGKTTLFKSILGLIKPDFGTIEVGETINIGYFSQGNDEFDENMRIIDFIKEKGEYIETTEGVLSASQFLENYLFSKTQQYMPIKSLSGGESFKAALALALGEDEIANLSKTRPSESLNASIMYSSSSPPVPSSTGGFPLIKPLKIFLL